MYAFSNWTQAIRCGAPESPPAPEPDTFLGRAAHVWRTAGTAGLAKRGVAFVRRRVAPPAAPYDVWIRANEQPASGQRALKQAVGRLRRLPVISLLVPVYQPEPRWLARAVQSVLAQIYPHWELCLSLDGPQPEWVGRALAKWASQDSRICVTAGLMHRGIAGATAAALAVATGAYVGLLDQDDELSPDALFRVAEVLQDGDTEVVYSDEDKLTPQGRRVDPFFKPDWSPHLLLSQMYTSHFSVYKRELVHRVGGFRAGFDGSQDYDLALRATEAAERVVHIPRVLYHWRQTPGSAAADPMAKEYAIDSAVRALDSAMERRGIAGTALRGTLSGTYRLVRAMAEWPLVSVLIPTHDRVDLLRPCVSSLLGITDYPRLEVLIVDHDSTDPATLRYLSEVEADPRVRVLRYSGEFNFSAMNNMAARVAQGEFLLFLNNDTEALSPDWLKELVSLGRDPVVGAVGSKLLFPDGRLHHAGVILGVGGVAANAFGHVPSEWPGYFGAPHLTRNYSAVTAACMLTPTALFREVGGFDEDALPVAFNDVDYCLRLRKAGKLIVYCPDAVLTHRESATRGREVDAGEVATMRCRWKAPIDDDPFYSPHLCRERTDFWIRL
ncbi:MAG: glycosyltransferase family 2 protein [Candidatus Wallbacteria bacterium]|nr:glycosyltransferase family 2 protein [Candidatus Wallbacteria bacterium]